MSNIEHLIENAIIAVESDYSFEQWASAPINKQIFQLVDIHPFDIWQIAIYIVYDYKPNIISDTINRLEIKYGYPIPND